MADSIDKLAGMTGLRRSDLLDAVEKVKQNVARLHACPDHHFMPIGPVAPLRTRYCCSNCLGEVDSLAYRWYMQGRDHEAKR